ncbi:hypothetical protein RRG08_041942 [Elysia crispata]|uniref:Uncharacterized protein n=1 Tax=Elysia crispata TaxID=231223 RepID=A0AAE0XXI5_9GAST|nr:hypothetical protein RRG08_041942 [Elysia crispata]
MSCPVAQTARKDCHFCTQQNDLHHSPCSSPCDGIRLGTDKLFLDVEISSSLSQCSTGRRSEVVSLSRPYRTGPRQTEGAAVTGRGFTRWRLGAESNARPSPEIGSRVFSRSRRRAMKEAMTL